MKTFFAPPSFLCSPIYLIFETLRFFLFWYRMKEEDQRNVKTKELEN